MRFFRDLAGLLLVIGLAAAPAFAEQGGEGNNTGCNGQGNPNSPCTGGNGGAGGAGGTGVGIGVGVGIGGGAHVNVEQTQIGIQETTVKTSSKSEVRNSGNSDVRIEGDKVEIPASAPSVFTGSLVASPETCLGSFQAGGSGSNGLISFGLTFGKTYVDPDCTRRMYARSLMLLGGQYNVAAVALLAQDENVAKALRAAGVPIPGQAAKADTTVPDLKLNTPLREPKDDEKKSKPSDFGKRAALSIPAAMAATQAAAVAAVQGN